MPLLHLTDELIRNEFTSSRLRMECSLSQPKSDSLSGNTMMSSGRIPSMPVFNWWTVNFLHEDLQAPAGRIHHFREFSSVRALYDRRGVVTEDEEVDLDHGEREGRGSFWMMLSDDDLARLRR